MSVILDLPFFPQPLWRIPRKRLQTHICKTSPYKTEIEPQSAPTQARPHLLLAGNKWCGVMEQGVVDSPVVLVIRAPNQKYSDQTINCCQNWTVEKLKAHLSDVYPSKPVSISRKTSRRCVDSASH